MSETPNTQADPAPMTAELLETLWRSGQMSHAEYEAERKALAAKDAEP